MSESTGCCRCPVLWHRGPHTRSGTAVLPAPQRAEEYLPVFRVSSRNDQFPLGKARPAAHRKVSNHGFLTGLHEQPVLQAYETTLAPGLLRHLQTAMQAPMTMWLSFRGRWSGREKEHSAPGRVPSQVRISPGAQ